MLEVNQDYMNVSLYMVFASWVMVMFVRNMDTKPKEKETKNLFNSYARDTKRNHRNKSIFLQITTIEKR